jgi:Cd2+/Zn2+-exporting ATPase
MSQEQPGERLQEPPAGERLRIDLPLLLPDAVDERDRCRSRLLELLEGRDGIQQVHLVGEGKQAELCVHYDADRLTLRQVEELARIAGARASERYGHGVFGIRAVDTEDAAQRIESAVGTLSGVVNVSVNLAAQRVRVEWVHDQASASQVEAALRDLGYAAEALPPVSPPRPEADAATALPSGARWLQRNKELVLSLIAGTALAAAWSAERWLELSRAGEVALYVVSYGFGAWDLLHHTVAGWRRGRVAFNIDLLMLLAALGAAVLGEWAEGAFLLFLFSLAHALEHYALGRARKAISSLAELAPAIARVRRNGIVEEVRVEQVAPGEVVQVWPAERIPVDGEVVGGDSSVNQAPITGESVPVDKRAGDEVFAGSVNGDGALEVRTTRAAGDRTLDRVIKLVEEAQTQKAPTQQFTERFERVFVPAVLVADMLLIVVPPLLGLWPWDVSFYRGMALLVAASPCALALGTPAAVLAGIAQAARHGVLVKGGAHLENLGSLRALAFDKTGTLTTGAMEVTDLVPFDQTAPEELLRTAGAVEALSQHPIAQAVVRRAQAEHRTLPTATGFQSITARGVRATLDGELVEIGSLRLWEDQGLDIDREFHSAVADLQSRGRTTMVVRRGVRWLGAIGVADRPRDGVRATLERLRSLGVRPLIMLTGDNQIVGDAIGHEVGVDEVRAGLLPEDKVTAIRRLIAQHGQVAMVGDGVNDAPALANATVGIAMGGAGTATALETADVALMGDDLGRLPFAIGLSRRARAVIRQNLYISLGVIALLVLATATGTIGIGLAVVAHEGSTLVVIANALRLLAYQDT